MIDKMIKDKVLKEAQLTAIGNSNRSLKDLAVDLINASKMDHKDLATGCFLCQQTITNLARGKTKNPQAETVERVLRFFETEVRIASVALKAEYQNKRKDDTVHHTGASKGTTGYKSHHVSNHAH